MKAEVRGGEINAGFPSSFSILVAIVFTAAAAQERQNLRGRVRQKQGIQVHVRLIREKDERQSGLCRSSEVWGSSRGGCDNAVKQGWM